MLLCAFPACLKKKTALESTTEMTKSNNWQKTGNATFDEDAQEFYLEDDSEDVFDEKKNSRMANDLDLVELDLDEDNGEVVQFQFDKTEVRAEEAPKIERNAEHVKDVLKDNKNACVVVDGHSCKIAKSKSYNYMISQERANNVAKSYQEQGVTSDKIKCVGHGDSQPVTNAAGKEGQAPNRRVETHFVKQANN